MQRENRKLAAIVAADIAGYSRLIGQDEEGTLRMFRTHRSDFIDPLIEQHGGRIANTAGDSFLLEFPSAVDATRCSIDLQDGMVQRNENIGPDSQIRFRIGIHIGDVIAQGGDLLGDSVNIAARLETLSDPGGIALSDDAHRQVRDRLEASWQDLGEHAVKNIARPLQVWRWLDGRQKATGEIPEDGRAPPLPDKPSIAVLPFENMSGDPEQDYFSDGVTEDIITDLSRLRWLFVIARNSSFTYKGQSVDVTRIGQELGVRYILEGSVRKAGQRVRVTAQLIEAATGTHIWAERYDRKLNDIFDLQDELTEAISANVDAELAGSERNLARRKSAADLDAWDYYQRGMWHLYKMSAAGIAEARRLFHIAAEQAPEFPSPHAALGYVAAIEALSGYAKERSATLDAGLIDAERAVKLDDRDGFNFFALGRVCTVLGLQDRAMLALEKSIELNPNSAHASYGLGMAHFWIGQAERAMPLLDRAIRLSPHDPQLWSFHYVRGNARFFTDDFEAAFADQRRAIQAKSDEYLPHLSLALLNLQCGRDDEALAAYENARKLKPELSESFLRDIIGNLHSPYGALLLDGLKRLGLPDE